MAPAFLTRRARILFIDAHDSFSNNIVAQVEESVDAEVVKISIDDPIFSCNQKDAHKTIPKRSVDFKEYLKTFDAVIAGPGPGSAKEEADVGLMNELWKTTDENMIPVLGICLGFQSLCLAFGAEISKLNEPRHGLVAEILHKGGSIFSDVDQLLATQYHSLQVYIDHRIQSDRFVKHPSELWSPTERCPDLEPLAWDFDNQRNGAVLMAVKHTQKPFWGVQFHPESICTNNEGTRVIQNWWNAAQAWNRRRTVSHQSGFSNLPTNIDGFKSKLHRLDPVLGNKPRKGSRMEDFKVSWTPEELAPLIAHGDGRSLPDLPPDIVHCATTGCGRLTVADVCELFDIPQNEAIVLESGLQSDLLPMRVGTGRYSIVGLVIPGETLRIHYYTTSHMLELRNGNDEVRLRFRVSDPWEYIKAIMQHLKPTQIPSGPTFAPFWGGLVGYVSYEAGLQTFGIESPSVATFPDICFAYITRSIVFDHQLKKIYVQSIRGPDDMPWVESTLEKIYEAVGAKSQFSTPNPTPLSRANPFEEDAVLNQYLTSCTENFADCDLYCSKVTKCQDIIADGHSYELCLTAPTNAVRALRPDISKPAQNELSWKLYKRLTARNPAPFSAYIRIHNVHILSSSPERFISWDRHQTAQCRPIKGTVRKSSGVTKADAMAILGSAKERAENLMIVDLVRHQLHGVYGSGNVHVKQLMKVEEYETLWQLVTVIDAIPLGMAKARTPDEWLEPSDYMSCKPSPKKMQGEKDKEMLGFDAFIQSLPAGSMTGAPKKRSCEILLPLEQTRRGIYSGALGYFDVGGAGDFSVVIRTAIKIDAEDFEDPTPKDGFATTEVFEQDCPPTSISTFPSNITPSTTISPSLPPSPQLNSSDSQLYDTWTIGAGGAITTLSDPSSEYLEMQGKFQSTAAMFKISAPVSKIVATRPLGMNLSVEGSEEVWELRGEMNIEEMLAVLEGTGVTGRRDPRQ
jgi:para-aminobenzoate synthetase